MYGPKKLQRTGGKRLMGQIWKMGSTWSGGNSLSLVGEAKCKALAEGDLDEKGTNPNFKLQNVEETQGLKAPVYKEVELGAMEVKIRILV